MIYPINIFSSEPTTGGMRPFMVFVAYKVEILVNKKGYKDVKNTVNDGNLSNIVWMWRAVKQST